MKQLISMLKQADPKQVVVVGDLMLDEYVVGNVERVSPEAPVPVLKEDRTEYSFGGAANVANNCRHVGCNVGVIGLLGEGDHVGSRLLAMLVEKKIFVEGVIRTSERITTRKKRIVAQQQQLLRIDSEDTRPLSSVERDHLICNIHTVIRPGSIILISDYAKGVVDHQIVQEVVTRAKVCGSLVIVDPKGPHFDKYRGVTYVKPNLKEFYQMVEFFGLSKKDSLVDNARIICELLQIEGLIITMGEQGIQYVSRKEQVAYPACKREVYDITGAGDTVLAFLAVGLVNGLTINQSLALANLAASVAVSHHKTCAVSLDELLEDGVEAEEKVCESWQRLRKHLAWLRAERKKKIVFTNGCFDLLHSGHIYLLHEAKKRGDILVVALNTDDSVSRLKGSSRPIKTFSERATILSAIDAVDFVVPFHQDTPQKLIEYVKPDVLIKGGDYSVESIVGYDIVRSYGGEVDVVGYKEGFSTTSLVKNAIKNS